jgi:Tfp pilus assembly protein PilO
VKQRKPLPTGAVYGLIAGGALFVALVGYLLLIKGQKDHVGRIKSEISSTRQTIDTFRAEAAASRPGAKPRIRVADIYRLARAMPTTAGMADIVLELNAVAQTTGIAIDGIAPQVEIAGNGFQIVPINIQFHGDFYSTSDFLYRLRTLVNVRHGQLEAGGRLFAVDKVTLTPAVDSSQELTGTATVQTFVYGAGAAASTAVPPTTTATTTTTSTSAEGAR